MKIQLTLAILIASSLPLLAGPWHPRVGYPHPLDHDNFQTNQEFLKRTLSFNQNNFLSPEEYNALIEPYLEEAGKKSAILNKIFGQQPNGISAEYIYALANCNTEIFNNKFKSMTFNQNTSDHYCQKFNTIIAITGKNLGLTDQQIEEEQKQSLKMLQEGNKVFIEKIGVTTIISRIIFKR